MFENVIRPSYQRLIADPLTKYFCANTSITANQITLLSLVTGIIAAGCIAFNFTIFAIIFLLLSGCLDSLDGTLARLNKNSSHLGTVFDIMSDRIVEVSIVLGFYLQSTSQRGLPCLLMLSSICLCVTSFLVVGIFSENQSSKSFHYSQGIMERFEAFVFFVTMLIIPQFFSVLAAVFTGLVLLTTAIRIYEFSQQKGT